MSIKETKIVSLKDRKTPGQFLLAFTLLLYAVFCVLPVLLIIISAFTDEAVIAESGFTYFPSKLSTEGFMVVLRYGQQLAVSYGVTIFITVVGTFLGLFFMSMYAYVLTKREFKMRTFLIVMITIPMLFSGGQLASYIVNTNVYHLKDTLFILIVPATIGTMNIIIMRTFIQTSIPGELVDSASIDGAGEYRIFFQIVLPLMKPVLAAIGFMMATGYWNEWQGALLYIQSDTKKPLQLLLMNISKNIDMLLNSHNVPSEAIAAMSGTIPSNSATMATVLIVIGPIIILYPFFQKYFVKGLTLGSVKG
ncbi:carbohydrate ABC transporter permease [Enterococcus sp.]|uniref:carbohydrate ABC transporter permease n=1 Tax=Enterococcus sp. TaxID=35783 RepID=UPI002FC62E7E